MIDELSDVEIGDYDVREIEREVKRDIQSLENIILKIQLAQQKKEAHLRDAKLVAVKELLANNLAGQKVLIFSYYRDTAQYVYDELCKDHRWSASWEKPPVIEVIHGGTDGNRRERLVKRFAPQANTQEKESSAISASEPEVDILDFNRCPKRGAKPPRCRGDYQL
ncbi:MAG UNVERIFIED_CONTAM: hypothetical protein LVT10_21810 [Anaerolineae bacterium]